MRVRLHRDWKFIVQRNIGAVFFAGCKYKSSSMARSVQGLYQRLQGNGIRSCDIPFEQPLEFEKREWTPTEKRVGGIATKKGMLSMWDSVGQMHPVTVLQMSDTYVLAQKTTEKDGFNALVLGAGRISLNETTSLKDSIYSIAFSIAAKLGFCVDRVATFRISPNATLPVGTQLRAAHFSPGQYIDIQSKSKDKGFQGAMKRWGFKGQGASHGVSKTHRSAGSTGNRKDPGKVFKGKKMAGHMGNKNVTVHSLKVLKIDKELDLIYVRGSIPGKNGSYVKMTDAAFKKEQFDPYQNPPFFPTARVEDIKSLPTEMYIDSQKEANPI